MPLLYAQLLLRHLEEDLGHHVPTMPPPATSVTTLGVRVRSAGLSSR
jgi:hypothetical protein